MLLLVLALFAVGMIGGVDLGSQMATCTPVEDGIPCTGASGLVDGME